MSDRNKTGNQPGEETGKVSSTDGGQTPTRARADLLGDGASAAGLDPSPGANAQLPPADIPVPPPKNNAKFLTGDPMRHITVMSLSASVGLVSLFIVDFLDLYFISLLEETALAAAVGFATTLLFFSMSLTIGLMIAMSALAARRIGAGDEKGAREIATSVLTIGVGTSVVFSILFWIFAPAILDMVGAIGDAKHYATRYIRITVPFVPLLSVGMVASGLLRAHGDARRAMNATLSAGIVNAIFDPLFIFGFGLGLDGAAYASVLARIAMVVTALLPILRRYGGFAPFNRDLFVSHLRPIIAIAGPAILTNLATPTGTVLVTRAIAPYGDAAVAGYAVIARLLPLAFVVVFALSGAIGPIIGQNYGAKSYDRVRETILKSVLFTGIYVIGMWLLVFFGRSFVADQFNLTGEGRTLVMWFGLAVAPLLFFSGVLFIANAALNNLDRPLWSTWLNWSRNTLGIMPFIMLGGAWGGAPGILIGQYAGAFPFALLGVFFIMRLINKLERAESNTGADGIAPPSSSVTP